MTEITQHSTEDTMVVQRQEFGGRELSHRNETASTAMAAQAKAEIESRYIMAMQRPRDWDTVRLRVLKDCARPQFAGTAWYRRPVGKKKNAQGKWEDSYAEGFSIRFAEAAMLAMGNLWPATTIIYDDNRKRIARVVVTDLESNLSYSVDVHVDKTVERRELKKGQIAITQRINSYGDNVFIVEASEAEVLVKQEALISKAVRKCALRLLPGDIQDEARLKVLEVRSNEAARDPDANRRKLIDVFSWYGVTPDMLAGYLGHPVATMSPAEFLNLQEVYTAVREGETWASIMNVQSENEAEEAKPQGKSGVAPKTLGDVVTAEKEKAEVQANVRRTDAVPFPEEDEWGNPIKTRVRP